MTTRRYADSVPECLKLQGQGESSVSKPASEKRKVPRLRREERAVIRTLNIDGEDVTVSKFYCTAVDISPNGLQIHSKKPFPMGEQLEIAINLGGNSQAHTLSGVTRWIAPSKDEPGYLLGVELINDRHAESWRHQFH